VEKALKAHPWVEEVSVKRILPGTLIIGIKEKTPVFWTLHNDVLHYADAYGRIIAEVMPGHFASLPALEVEAGAEDSASALPDLVKSLNDSRLLAGLGAVTLIRLSAARGVEVYIDDARLKMTIGLEDWLANLKRLGLVLADLTRRDELSGTREIRAQGANVWVEKRKPVSVQGQAVLSEIMPAPATGRRVKADWSIFG
jgi:cell division protein FtsQ